MSLSPTQKQSLLQQLYHLSTDTQLQPYLDSTTTQRITKLLQSSNFPTNSTITPSHHPTKQPQSIPQKKYKTQIQQIDQINKQYERRFGDLFGGDQQDEEKGDINVLREIDVRLDGNNSCVGRKNFKCNNFVHKMSQLDSTHTKSHRLSTKNLKQAFTKTMGKKQNINSLTSTHSNFFHTKTNDQPTTLKRKPSKQKLISYKIKTQENNSNGYEMCTPSPNKLVKRKERTPSKMAGSQSRSNLQPLTKSPINKNTTTNNNSTLMKRSQSQSTKFLITTNPGSLNSTSKHQKLPLLRNSESKSSLSTSKLKSASKKSTSVLETTATKRHPTGTLPSIDDNRARGLKDDGGSGVRKKDSKRSKSKSKSKEKYVDVSMKKGIKRCHTQCSVEKIHLRDDFLQQMRVDQELNFEVMNEANNIKKSYVQIEKLEEKQEKEDNCRRVVTQMFINPNQSQQDYLYQSSQELQPSQEQNKSCNTQQQLQQDQPAYFQVNQQIITPTKPNQQKSQKSNMNQLHDSKTTGYDCLKRIMGDINYQRQQKMRLKVQYQREITQLKQKVLQQKRSLQSTLLTNSKLQNQLHFLSTTIKSTTTQRCLLTRCIQQTRKVTCSLKQSLTKNHSLLQKLTTQQLKQQQQLIQMYQNVINELKSQIKEQFKKKLQAKNQLQMCHKKKQGKLTKFNSTLLSSQKLKFNLTDAFRQWV